MEAAAPSAASLGLPSLSNGSAMDDKLPDLSAPLPPLNDSGELLKSVRFCWLSMLVNYDVHVHVVVHSHGHIVQYDGS